ncbi:YdcF family protein [Bradyrhizobium sp. HKCCYLS3077]|uniref:YdcF family protein n=1 Tax=Bradyrhizobium sp. HKCCYLS3077 TaxID=3420761 RepID=UPI003EBC876D
MQDRALRMPDAAEIAAITARHFADTSLRPADLLFVFGTRIEEDLRAETAGRLWQQGYFRHAIVSGGITPGADASECTLIKAAMVRRGVPAERILEEHQALNTGENVVFSLPVIEAVLGLANIRSVICLGNSWTARRYAMTLQRHWPEVEKMLLTVDGFGVPRHLWHTHPEFRRRVLSEWDKIESYKARGFIAEWP